ncbi:DUF2905 domain-containing protein [bacterium]|nr:DUF2905 domain-containing protein [bacterium]
MMQRIGVFLIGLGILLVLLGRLPFLGKLPGDILVKRDNWTFYFPVATSVVLSVVLSLILTVVWWWWSRRT